MNPFLQFKYSFEKMKSFLFGKFSILKGKNFRDLIDNVTFRGLLVDDGRIWNNSAILFHAKLTNYRINVRKLYPGV